MDLFRYRQSGAGQYKRLKIKEPTILVVGPLPPPLTGTPISFQLFCDEVQRRGWAKLDIIDASPHRLKQGMGTGISLDLANLRQAARIVAKFAIKVWRANRIVIFGSSGYIISLGPILLMLARLAHKPCYFRIFGGSLDRYCALLPKPLRWFAMRMLGCFDGVLVQTDLLRRFCSEFLPPAKVHVIPGYRTIKVQDTQQHSHPKRCNQSLRLAFLGIIKPEKGVYTLLESLRQLGRRADSSIRCDLYGAIPEGDRTCFEKDLARTPNATYCGVLPWHQVIPTLQGYDALVLPTYYHGEGHPGVLIEAMVAGIPVITTSFRSIPEIVENQVNGLLVPPEDSANLAEAIWLLYETPGFRKQLAQNNYHAARRFDVRHAAPQLLHAIGVHKIRPASIG